MAHFVKPLVFRDRDLPHTRGKSGIAALKGAALFALLIAYGLGFAILYPLTQASASKSAAGGNDPMLFVGP
jgi:hypothetical protein